MKNAHVGSVPNASILTVTAIEKQNKLKHLKGKNRESVLAFGLVQSVSQSVTQTIALSEKKVKLERLCHKTLLNVKLAKCLQTWLRVVVLRELFLAS